MHVLETEGFIGFIIMLDLW